PSNRPQSGQMSIVPAYPMMFLAPEERNKSFSIIEYFAPPELYGVSHRVSINIGSLWDRRTRPGHYPLASASGSAPSQRDLSAISCEKIRSASSKVSFEPTSYQMPGTRQT